LKNIDAIWAILFFEGKTKIKSAEHTGFTAPVAPKEEGNAKTSLMAAY